MKKQKKEKPSDFNLKKKKTVVAYFRFNLKLIQVLTIIYMNQFNYCFHLYLFVNPPLFFINNLDLVFFLSLSLHLSQN